MAMTNTRRSMLENLPRKGSDGGLVRAEGMQHGEWRMWLVQGPTLPGWIPCACT